MPLADHAPFIALVATEAVDESDAIERHPEIIDVLQSLAADPELHAAFGANGHDPAAFVAALAAGLAPYRERPLEQAHELVEALGFVAWRLQHADAPMIASSFSD